MKQLLIYSIFVLFSLDLYSQNSFEISYATEEDEYFNGGIVDKQGNIVLTGHIGDYTLTNHDGIIMKIYPDGSYIVRRIERQDTIGGFSSITLLDNVITSYSIHYTKLYDTLKAIRFPSRTLQNKKEESVTMAPPFTCESGANVQWKLLRLLLIIFFLIFPSRRGTAFSSSLAATIDR